MHGKEVTYSVLRDSGGIYVASRASVPERPALWRRLREDGWPIVSSWIDEDGPGESDFKALWLRVVEEVRGAAVLVVYLEPSDLPVRGVFVEVGIALAFSKPVLLVAPDVDAAAVGSWTAHPTVTACRSLADAMAQAVSAPPAGLAQEGE